MRLLCLLVLAPGLLAQDLQLGLDQQRTRSLEILPTSGGFLRFRGEASEALSIRANWDIWKPFKAQALELTGGVRLPSDHPLAYSNSSGLSGRVPTGTRLRIDTQYALGFLYRFEHPFEWPLETGLGLEQRWERMEMRDGGLKSSGSLDRVWARALIRYRFARGPFVALEYARPLSSAPTPSGEAYLQDMDNLGHSPDPGTAAKSHAPTYALTLAAGYRFRRTPKPAPAPQPEPEPVVVAPAVPAPEPSPVPPPPGPVVAPVPAPEPAPEPVLPKVITLDEAAFHFALNRAEIPPQGLAVLRIWAARLKALERAPRLTVIGHTDSTGRRAYNLRLSAARAQSVADALIAEGLAVEGVQGLGSDQPIASNDSPEGRARNRRVEIHLEADGIRVEGQSASELVLEASDPVRP